MARKAQPKRRIDIPEFDTLYIPPFSDFCSLIKRPTGVVTFINMLQESLGSELNVGRSTIAKLTSEGVSENTFNKISEFLSPLFKKLSFSRWVIRDLFYYIRLRSNYVSWYGPIEGVSKSFAESPDPRSPMLPMMSFVKDRGSAQLELFPILKRLRKQSGQSDRNLVICKWVKAEQELFERQTLVPMNVLAKGSSVILKALPMEKLSQDQKHLLSEYSLHLYWDFYLSSIAMFDLIGVHVNDKNINDSAFSYVFNKLSDDNGVGARTAFYLLLEFWRNEYCISTWTEFSKGIPITDEVSVSGVTSGERQKHQLKRWRKGKDHPSEEMLIKFLKRLPENPTYKIELMAFHGVIALGIDKLIKLSINGQTAEGIVLENCLSTIKEVFSLYPQHCSKISNYIPYCDWQSEWNKAAA